MKLRLKSLEKATEKLDKVVSAHQEAMNKFDKILECHRIFIDNAAKSINGVNEDTSELSDRLDRLVMWLVGALFAVALTLIGLMAKIFVG